MDQVWWVFHRSKLFTTKQRFTNRYCQDSFFKLGIKPHKYASSENKHSITQSCHCQTDQNYEQCQKKLDAVLKIKTFKKYFHVKTGLLVQYSSQNFFWKRSTNFQHWKWLWKSEFWGCSKFRYIWQWHYLMKKCLFPLDTNGVSSPTQTKNLWRYLFRKSWIV